MVEGPNPVEIPVVVTEISVGGLGLRAKQPLGINITYRISSFDTLIPGGTKATIISQRQLDANTFEVGAKVA